MRATRAARRRCVHNADHFAHDTPLSAFVAEVAGYVGATPPRTVTSPPRTAASLPANGGNCTNRGATRRRHADRMLLMVQKPPLCLGGGGLGVDRGAKRRGAAVWARRPSCPDMTGGNCTNRGATRRRHADRMLLMVQNPHRHPWRHAPSLASCSLTGAGLPGEVPTNAGRASPTGPCYAGVGRAGRR